MGTPPSVSKIVRPPVAAVAALVFAAGLLLVTGSAGAVPMPTVAQVQHRISVLESQVSRLGQQYDQVKQELAATDQQLRLVDRQLGADGTEFDAERVQIIRIAVTAYEDGNLSSSIALLTSDKPQEILNQSSILLELSDINNAEIAQFLAEARQLTSTQQVVRRTKIGILQLRNSEARRIGRLRNLVSQENQLLSELTPAQQAAVGPGGGSTTVKYTGPTSTQADKAVQYAYQQLGCPYVYGGTGPCQDGFDCSGLTMEAWAAAGVSIPRTSYQQWDDLPHVSLSDLQPGDILVFLGAGHVGLYVGNNELIDAPQPGEDVQLVSFTGWYQQNVDGAVRP